VSKLGEICHILNGYAFKSEKYVDSGIRIIRITNVQKGYIEDSDPKFYPLDQQNELSKYMLEIGDLLMSLTGNVGRVAVLTEPFLPAGLNQRVACLRLKSDDIYKPFLFHILNSDYFESKCIEAANGIAQKNLSTEWLKDFEIPLPPLETQKQIAANLDKVTHTINLCNEILEKLDLLVKARFVEMFGDPYLNPKGFPIKRIDEVSELNKGITYSPEQVCDNGIIVLRSSNIKGSDFDINDLVRISKEVLPEKMVHKNDILMCNRNGSARLVGKVAKIPELNEKMTFGTFMTIIRSEYYEYLFTFFQTKAFREQIKFQTAVAINQISLPLLSEVKVPLPPIELQTQFADFVTQTDKSKLAVKQVLEKAETLKKALMQEYFG